MRVWNESRDVELAAGADVTHGPVERFLGLMGRSRLGDGGGLVLPQTSVVHTHFMRFAIDILFVDRNAIVVGLVERLRPWRISPRFRNAVGTIELPAGTIGTTETRVGDRISFSPPGVG